MIYLIILLGAMKVINVIGRILGGLASVFILISLFMTTLEIKSLNISMYSMSVFEYNRIGSLIILVLAILGLAAAYFNKGFLMCLISIAILVSDFYAASSMNMGSTGMETIYNKITFLFGNIFSPDVGFVFIVIGSIVMFLAGAMTNKSKSSAK